MMKNILKINLPQSYQRISWQKSIFSGIPSVFMIFCSEKSSKVIISMRNQWKIRRLVWGHFQGRVSGASTHFSPNQNEDMKLKNFLVILITYLYRLKYEPNIQIGIFRCLPMVFCWRPWEFRVFESFRGNSAPPNRKYRPRERKTSICELGSEPGFGSWSLRVVLCQQSERSQTKRV